jgi:hypothetical protein
MNSGLFECLNAGRMAQLIAFGTHIGEVSLGDHLQGTLCRTIPRHPAAAFQQLTKDREAGHCISPEPQRARCDEYRCAQCRGRPIRGC